MKKTICLLGISAILVATPCNIQAQVSPSEWIPCQEMPALIQRFNADSRVLNRYYSPALNNSRGGFGADWSIGSPEKNTRLQKLVKDYQQQLAAVNFKNLSQECKADYILFKRDLSSRLEQLQLDAASLQKVASWVGFTDKIYALEQLRRRGTQPDAKTVAKDWNDIIDQVKQLQDKLKKTSTIDPDDVATATAAINNARNTVQSIFEFYNGYDPLFSWWVPVTQKTLDETLNAYSTAFRAKANSTLTASDKSGIVGVQAGRESLIRQLKNEMIPYTPEELIEIANKEFAWCEAEMLKAAKEMGFGNDWKAALEKVKNTYVPEGKQPELILKLYNESIDFLKKNQLITIPPLAEETWGMMMMSPERQLVAPFFLGGTDFIISYPTNTLTYPERMMSILGNKPHFSKVRGLQGVNLRK